jgi:biotin operon repressor
MSQEILMNIYDEIVKLRQLFEMTVKDKLEKELEKILTTTERKMVWALSDGFTDTKKIAKKVGISRRAVQLTIKDLQTADLVVVERRGYPKRKFDHVPSKWTSKDNTGGK